MTDYENIIEKTAAKTGLEEADVAQKVGDKLSEWREGGAIQTEEQDEIMKRHAAMAVKNELLELGADNQGGGGGTDGIPVLALGYRREGTSLVDGDGIRAAGLMNPPEGKAGLCIFLIDGADGVDLDHAKEAFSPLQTIRASGRIRQVGTYDNEPTLMKVGAPTYNFESTSDSTFEIVDPDDADDNDPLSDLPSTQEAKRSMLNKEFIPEEETMTVSDFKNQTATKNSSGWAAGLGVDIKRLRGEVVNAISFEGGGGYITVTDDTVYDEEDVSAELISDKQRVPGVQVDIERDHIVGENRSSTFTGT
jgi:hypothetical protein